MKIYHSLPELIGHTPLFSADNFSREQGLETPILAKLEYFNPAGSIKDRVALNIIEKAAVQGLIQKGSTIIEPTSGNTGIGVAAICAAKGYKAIIVMPENMSNERKLLMKAYGAELVLTPAAKGMAGAVAKADEIHAATAGSIIAGQFTNPANPEAHIKTTGPEIWADTEGKVDILVAGIGTGRHHQRRRRIFKREKSQLESYSRRARHLAAFDPRAMPVRTVSWVSAQTSFPRLKP